MRSPAGTFVLILGIAVAGCNAARKIAGLPPLIEHIDIMRWGHGMVLPAPGTIASAERAAAARSVGPLHFAHTDLSGLALFEEAFFHGTRAAREVLAA